MTNRIYLNGKEQFNCTVSVDTAKPATKPPTDDKPPARQVTIIKGDGVTVRELGPLTQTYSGRQVTIDRGETMSLKFVIPKAGKVPVVFFSFEPRENKQYLFNAWLSEKPDGKPVGGRYGQLSGLYRRNQPFGLAASVKGRGAERRGAPLHEGKYYHLNLKHNGPKMTLRWELGGAFK
jgi:hypothetical protein